MTLLQQGFLRFVAKTILKPSDTFDSSSLMVVIIPQDMWSSFGSFTLVFVLCDSSNTMACLISRVGGEGDRGGGFKSSATLVCLTKIFFDPIWIHMHVEWKSGLWLYFLLALPASVRSKLGFADLYKTLAHLTNQVKHLQIPWVQKVAH